MTDVDGVGVEIEATGDDRIIAYTSRDGGALLLRHEPPNAWSAYQLAFSPEGTEQLRQLLNEGQQDMTSGQFREVDPAGPIGEQPFVIDRHAFDSQVGKVVNLTANGERIGRVRLVGATLDEEGWRLTLETLRPGEEESTVAVQEPAPTVVQRVEPVQPPMQAHEHVWSAVEVNSNDYHRTPDVADPRPRLPQPGLVCGGSGPCSVIDDPERGPWAGLPLNIVLEGDPRE